MILNGSAPEGELARFEVVDDGFGSGRAFTIGLPLELGRVPSGTPLVVTTEDGTVLSSQWNELARWRPDGSALHGALTFVTEGAGDNSGTYYVRTGEQTTGGAITRSDVVDAGFDASVSVQIGSGTYSLSAADLLSGAVAPRQNYTHFSGPLAAEFVVGGGLRQNGTGSEHATLQAYFYVRAFGRPVERTYVTVALENTGAFRSLMDVSASSVDVRVGASSLPGFPKSSLPVHADVRYVKRAWWNGDPDLWVRHDVEQVQDSRLVPEYREIAVAGTMLSGFPQATDWNERRILTETTLSSGGAKPELAPYDRWTAAYLISGDRRAWNAMRAAQDEYGYMVRVLGGAVMRPRDENTGLPIDLGVHGVISQEWGTAGQPNVLNAHRDGAPQATTDLAHQPAIGYVTYLLTAEASELENLQFSAINTWLNERPGGYAGTIPNRRWGAGGQVRSLAWGFREVLNAGTVTPVDHPLRSTMVNAVTNALQEMNDRGRPLDPADSTGLWLTGPGFGVAIIYDSGDTPNPSDTGAGGDDGVGVALWQNDWLTWTIGAAYEQGWRSELATSGLWNWKAQSIVSRLATNTEGFCWAYSAGYAIGVQDAPSGPLYSSWSEIFDRNYPGVSSCAASGASLSGGDRAASDYAAQMAPALGVAVDTGVSGAASAWSVYDARSITDWNGFSNAPEWAIQPR